ncbi:hypothetical protein VTK56DRAFT_2190 [Thermocarpiscus australiensis]
MAVNADAVALAVLEEFRKLPAKRKPTVRDNGLREWVPLSGIVVKGPNFLKCVALATGMKCLPASKLPQANGVALHDWHAEVLALRAFNRFVLDECRRLAEDNTAQSDFLRRRSQAELSRSPSNNDSPPFWNGQPFAWREDLTLHMYCSEAPCGDASMELIISSQPDTTPWTIPPSTASDSPTPTQTPSYPQPLLLGRGYFSQLGIVRRKPGRGDAPATASKSCSDKLALRQCTSALCALAALLVHPRGAYLATLVLPASQFSAAACARCFSGSVSVTSNGGGGSGGVGGVGAEGGGAQTGRESTGGGGDGGGGGRMRAVAGRVWEGTGYAFVPFRVETTEVEFEFSRRALVAGEGGGGGGGKDEVEIKTGASNLAVAWTMDGQVEEGLIGGVLQGRKAFDVKGASSVSRRRMWMAAVEVAAALRNDQISRELANRTYDGVKEGVLLAGRGRVKEEVREQALKGWLRNTGDGGFSL